MIPTRIFVINWTRGPAWLPELPITEQQLDDHRAYISYLDAKGRIVIAGPFLGGESGGLAIVRAASREEALEMMNADPAVLTGVFSGTVRPMYAVFGGDGKTAVGVGR